MTEASVYGKSYGEIVVHAFRKNWTARIALWICVAMVVVAVLAPVLANDRPITFFGALPGEYARSFRDATRGGYFALLGLPSRLKNEAGAVQDGSVTLSVYRGRLTDAENRAHYDFITRLENRSQFDTDTRALWISGDIPIADVIRELESLKTVYPQEIDALKRDLAAGNITEEQRTKKEKLLEETEKALAEIPRNLEDIAKARARIAAELADIYTELAGAAVEGLRFKLDQMADQLESSGQEAAGTLGERLESIVGEDYVTTTEDRRPALKEWVEAVKAQFDPQQAVLVEKRRWPVVDSLDALDVLMILALLGALLAFGPLTWWGPLKRLAPIERRWTRSWIIALAPALLVSAVWLLTHQNRFETVSYKRGTQDGSVVIRSALWPVHAWRYDEVPLIEITKDADRPPLPPSRKHPFGTDFLGRDLLARMIWGSRVSLAVGFVATFIALQIGIVLGALAGYYRGRVDLVISRVIEIVTCFPQLFIILAAVAFLPPNIYLVMLVLGLFGWMGIARLQRGEFLRLVNQDFVQAAVALGARRTRVMFRHILPNALAPVLVAASFGIAGAMLTESALSFLGFGVQEPETSWGQILYTGRSHVLEGGGKWWTFTIPGIAIFMAVTCYNLVGDGIRDAVDPRLKT